MIGKKISQYRILEKIGKGGMGVVYLAEDTLLKRKVAIKILPPHSTFDDTARKRFQREAQTAAALNHPNIITVYQMFEHNNRFFIAMEYVAGDSLRQRIATNGSHMPVQEILSLASQICEGMAVAHRAGIVHRDIKPENILITAEGRIKLLDFGLAKLKGSSKITSESSTMGTFFYMSPEQAQGSEVDNRSDIFSIGVVLYEMLTGKLPFKGEYDVAVVYSIINDRPAPLRSLRPDIPADLEFIVERAIAKNPDNRYQSAEEMGQDLKSVLSGVPLKTGKATSAEQKESHSLTVNQVLGDSSQVPRSIDELLEQREKIDKLIAHKFTRNLTVMFSDIVNSTAYFEQWGDLEGRALVQRYNNLMFPIIKKNNGRVVKTIGDGILSSFEQPNDAAACAIAMLRGLAVDNQSRLIKDKIAIRVAMHYGQAVVDKSDVYGDVVNVAARIEKFAGENDIVLSEALYNQIKENQAFALLPVGEGAFKGKKMVVKLYTLLWQEDDITAFRAGTFTRLTSSTEAVPESEAKTYDSAATSTAAVVIHKPYKVKLPEKRQEGSLSDELKNPYMNRVKIQNIDEFYGRKTEVSKIFSRIGASRPQSISLVGERRIGKSSLLNFVYHPRNRLQYLKEPHNYLFLFLDFQEKRGITVDKFFHSIFESLQAEFEGELSLNVPADYEGFKKVVNVFDREHLRFILIFDEFEVITKNKNFGAEFYSFFRSIANNYNVAYIVSSGRNLQTLCHSCEISDSPFFNIFSNLTLTQFNHAEAEELIVQPAEKMGYDMKPYIPFIVDIAGYYPFFIQMACAAIFQYVKNGDPFSRQIQESVKEEFWDEAKVHFQQIWDICEEEERDVLMFLAAEREIPHSQQYLVKKLTKEGYVKKVNQKPRVFSSQFAEFILQTYGLQRGIKRKKRFLFW